MARARRPRGPSGICARGEAARDRTGAACGCGDAGRADRDCGDFGDQAAAQQWLDAHPGDPDGLDSDGNGRPASRSARGAAAAPTPAPVARA